jgi:hypothetical protein
MSDFGTIERERILGEVELFVIAHDEYPISPGHSLVIVKKVVVRFQELTADEFFGVWSYNRPSFLRCFGNPGALPLSPVSMR